MHQLNKSYTEIKKIQQEFSRFIGFCILFKSTENIDEYMLIQDEKKQIGFLKKQIAKKLVFQDMKLLKKK